MDFLTNRGLLSKINRLLNKVTLFTFILVTILTLAVVLGQGLKVLPYMLPLVLVTLFPNLWYWFSKDSRHLLKITIGIFIILTGVIIFIDPDHAKLFHLIPIIIAGLTFNKKYFRVTSLIVVVVIVGLQFLLTPQISVVFSDTMIPLLEIIILNLIMVNNTEMILNLFYITDKNLESKNETMSTLKNSIGVLTETTINMTEQFSQLLITSEKSQKTSLPLQILVTHNLRLFLRWKMPLQVFQRTVKPFQVNQQMRLKASMTFKKPQFQVMRL